MRFFGRKRRPRPAGPRKNQWKESQGEKAAKGPSRVKIARRKALARRVGLAIGAGLVAWLVVMGLRYSGPALQSLLEIKTITVEGEHHIDEQKVLELAKVKLGTGLHHIVTRVIKERVESHPWIKEAVVTRVPFHELRIALVERIPAAVIRADSQNFLTDVEGHVLTRLGQTDDEALPLVTGIDSKGLLEGTESVRQVITSGIKLATLVGQTFEGRLRVNVENPSNLVALVQGMRFQFGAEAVGEQWERFRRVKPTLKTLNFDGHGRRANEVDLRYENRIVVREGG
ncbi:MAG: FtsQ-type POTRA domain-containing protein [Nitrospira sp.]|nr:FtsQ-type POTRA domain-containing protein [Nitrospira sp.]